MKQVVPLFFKRESLGYFRSSIACILFIVFPMVAAGLASFVGKLYRRNFATLGSYFAFHPWLFLFPIPAANIQLWSEGKGGNGPTYAAESSVWRLWLVSLWPFY